MASAPLLARPPLLSPPPLLLLLLAANAAAQYTGPFTQLTSSFLNVADPADGFGPEDKLCACQGDLVFIDLDEQGGEWFRYAASSTKTWSRGPISQAGACAQGGPLYPRDAGYTVAVTVNESRADRLVILGGSSNEHNVYYSDDCGATWSCYSANQIWDPRAFASLIHTDGIFPGDPLVMLGGLSLEQITSYAQFESTNGGRDWKRPTCADAAACRGTLASKGFGPDLRGFCADTTDALKCYMLPDLPSYAGSVATDWSTMWFWLEAVDDGTVWFLNSTNYASGWTQYPAATSGGYGRKVFIRGAAKGSGCFFSTDWTAEDLWVGQGTIGPGQPIAYSSSGFATAPSAIGPWRNWTGLAPWTPRASGALTTSWRSTSAWYGSGMTFSNGVASAPVFSDVWEIDAGICLLAPSSGKVCNGNGQPDLVNVACVCVAGTSGPYCENGSPASSAAASPAAAGPAVAVGVSIAVIAGLAAAAWVFVARFGGTIPGVDALAALASRLGGGGGTGSSFAPRAYSPTRASPDKAAFITSSSSGSSASPGAATTGYGAL